MTGTKRIVLINAGGRCSNRNDGVNGTKSPFFKKNKNLQNKKTYSSLKKKNTSARLNATQRVRTGWQPQ